MKMKDEAARIEAASVPAVRGAFANPFLEAAAESADSVGKLLKFSKGRWFVGDDEVRPGTEYVAHVSQVMRGWIRFDGGKVAQRLVGKIADGFKPPSREELGDNDTTKWDKDSQGKPRDPWTLQWYLPLVGVENSDLLTFVTGSRGGISALSDLCRIYGSKERNGALPVVALETRNYKHETFGRIDTPHFGLVGWDEPAVKQVASGAEFSDSVPF
jgi:hypothetical protein